MSSKYWWVVYGVKLDSGTGFKPIDTVRGQGYIFTEACR